ncbi:hypothetical protein [Pseudomonas aeruginosa]|uniref:hypothetical protein n=1 Tax=Pseudomonas aeruginosa TaxID=287 RepID=UPI0004EFA4BE|nr:hypothetical protein [Pseudomonas aeruginosa]CDO80885.1 hypothetical protein PA3070 [Pseudomonas aeruginosa]HCI1689756.1 hypothetical protein [Pseudomonas aeruginosa]
MSIDWSTAPEGATHWEPRSDKYREAWMKSAADKWFFWGSRRKAWIEESGISAEREATFEARPQDAWDGKGLPPVGISVEWLSSAHGWLGGRVVGHDGSVAVVSHNDGYTGCHPHEVRPMPTPEQIAAEEREKAISEMLDLYINNGAYWPMTSKQFCEILFDAGYRRQESST